MAETEQFKIAEYVDDSLSDPIQFRVGTDTETLWATQGQIADLFGTKQPNASIHLRNIFDEEELDRDSNIKKFNIAGSAKPVTAYSLDAVISVGFRVNSKRATRFRQWSVRATRSLIEDGYALDEQTLRRFPEKLNKLASEVRALRATEKSVYEKVRECFKVSASDYSPNSDEMKTFYALLQDKFIHAVTQMTSASIIIDRADHMDENMGVQSFSGRAPKASEVIVGKNYLQASELYRLHLLSEQFLLYAETTALKGRKMTMASLHTQLDKLLIVNEYHVFPGYRKAFREQAEEHARRELRHYKVRLKVEEAGIQFDPEAHASGDYSEILS